LVDAAWVHVAFFSLEVRAVGVRSVLTREIDRPRAGGPRARELELEPGPELAGFAPHGMEAAASGEQRGAGGRVERLLRRREAIRRACVFVGKDRDVRARPGLGSVRQLHGVVADLARPLWGVVRVEGFVAPRRPDGQALRSVATVRRQERRWRPLEPIQI